MQYLNSRDIFFIVTGVSLLYFETGIYCVALAVLELERFFGFPNAKASNIMFGSISFLSWDINH